MVSKGFRKHCQIIWCKDARAFILRNVESFRIRKLPNVSPGRDNVSMALITRVIIGLRINWHGTTRRFNWILFVMSQVAAFYPRHEGFILEKTGGAGAGGKHNARGLGK